jgi:hypothetical protein
MPPNAYPTPDEPHMPPESKNSDDTSGAGSAPVPQRSSRDDDLFYFLDKAAGWMFVLGLGHLLLQRVPGGFWIATVFTVVGGMIKLLFRIL